MSTPENQARAIFIEAIEQTSPEKRAELIAAACGDNLELRAHVERLIRSHEQLGSFHDAPPVDRTLNQPSLESPGTQIGPYKLLQQIGEGGMGTVYMAEQTQPVQRKVALKIIKPGMDSRQIIARFEAERQALAMMDHVNIARVLDAGATEGGRPYFVMELVRGVPITQYCDDNHLTPRERLELFVPVCQAIQHAHQKGIIHRDIKPSNVMVTLYDGKPVPKVIDFGVAKATEQKLTERTLFTQYGTLVGTLEYMSPEQAEMSALGVDTRSDIYSLGVLLYELLTGSTPLSGKRMKEAAYAEILRLIKEEEPPRPSTRLSESGEALASISAQRKTEPAKLSKLMRGELDWIVMKTLEKDRNRRYETASGFAQDVQRYLADEPVQACPPSAGYRLRKFVRRNKRALATAVVVALAMLVAVGTLGWVERDRTARKVKLAGQIELILAEVERLEREQQWSEALAAAKRAEAVLAGGEADEASRQRVGDLIKELALIDRLERIRMDGATVVEGKFNDAGAVRDYGRAFREYGVDVEVLPVETTIDRLRVHPALAIPLAAALDDWVAARRVVAAEDTAGWKRLVAVARGIDPESLRDRFRAAWGHPVTPEFQATMRRLVESIDLRSKHPTTLLQMASMLSQANLADVALRVLHDAQQTHPGDFWLTFTLGERLSKRNEHEGAVRFYTAAVSIRPNSGAAHNNLGVALGHQNKLDEAIAAYRRAIDLDPKYAGALSNLGNALRRQGKLDEAIACCRKAIQQDPKLAGAHFNLGLTLANQGKLDEAIAAYCSAIDLDPKYAPAHNNLGAALQGQDQGKLDEAIAAYRRAIDLDPEYAIAHNNLGNGLMDQGKVDEATASYKLAIEIDPKLAPAHNNLGTALRDKGKLDEAIAAYRRAIDLDPKYAGAHNNLGNSLMDQGKADEAIACFRTALTFDSTNPHAHSNLGLALQNRGSLADAIACYREAIRIRADHAMACNQLAWLLATAPDVKLRDSAEAVKLAMKAVESTRGAAECWNTLGVAHYRAGNWQDAIKALENSMDHRKGGDAFDWFFLAMAYWQLDAKAEASRWYDQAVQWIEKNRNEDEELRRFRTEAEELLTIKKK